MKSEFEFLKERDIEVDMKEMNTYMNGLETSEFSYRFGRAVITSVISVAIIAVIGLIAIYMLWK